MYDQFSVQINTMDNIERSMLYPGSSGMINQSIATAQRIKDFRQTQYNSSMPPCIPSMVSSTSSQLSTKHSWDVSSVSTRLHKKPSQSSAINLLSDDMNCLDSLKIKCNITISRDNSDIDSANLVKEVFVENASKHICGRKIYTREKMVTIRNSSLCKEKSRVFVIEGQYIDQIILEYLIGLNSTNTFKTFENKGKRNKQKVKNRQIIDKHSNQPKRIDLGVEEPLQLREDGYKLFKNKLVSGIEVDASEEFIRQLKGILNRIVPQNFDQCFIDLISLDIYSRNKMSVLVNEIFFKAVNEEAYSVLFAKLCYKLSSFTNDLIDNEPSSFRDVLLLKCQEMFITPLETQLEVVREECISKVSIDGTNIAGPLKDDVEEQLNKCRDKYYGNIRFIGELYLKDVIVIDVICFCVDHLLLDNNTTTSVVCLCKLLETCGEKLEAQCIGKQKLDQVFEALQRLAECGSTDSRTRFRIRDLVEMRTMNWSLRQIQRDRRIEPRTLDEMKCMSPVTRYDSMCHDADWRNIRYSIKDDQ